MNMLKHILTAGEERIAEIRHIPWEKICLAFTGRQLTEFAGFRLQDTGLIRDVPVDIFVIFFCVNTVVCSAFYRR
jgi:hypothetical protein